MADVERDQGKKAKTDAVARAVIGETIILFLTKLDKQFVTSEGNVETPFQKFRPGCWSSLLRL